MSQKVCISKKITFFVSVISIITLLLIIFSTSLLKTKTNYQSKAAPPASVKSITNGSSVIDPKKWPYMVMIQHKAIIKSTLCGGSLIAPGWVLTAGHCIQSPEELGKQPNFVTVGVGNDRTKQQNYDVPNVEGWENRIFIHPDYRMRAFTKDSEGEGIHDNDIALIKLDWVPEDSDGNDIPTLSLNTDTSGKFETDGMLSVILGWGEGGLRGAQWPTFVQQAAIPLLSMSRKSLTEQFCSKYIDDTELIAGYQSGDTNISTGDSGGPIQVWNGTNWIQVGISKRRESCSGSNTYKVFTKLSNKKTDYIDWIMKTINKNGFPPGVDKSYVYKGTGTFVGALLNPLERYLYDERICSKDEWGEELPKVCSLNRMQKEKQ